MKTRTKPNVRFLACMLALVAVLGLGVHFVHGFQVKRNAVGLLHQADKAKEDGKTDKELNYLSRYLGLVPEDFDSQARLAVLIDEQAVKDKSIKGRMLAFFKLEAVLRRDPKRNDIRRRLVDTAMTLGRYTDALAHLKVLHEAAPADAELERLLGICEEASGHYQQAVEAYERAARHAPKKIENYLAAARVLHDRLEKNRNADEMLDAMVQANPDDFNAYLARANFHLRLTVKLPETLKSTEADVRKAQELAPDEPDVVLVAANLARAKETPEKAREILQRGLKAHPRDPRLYLSLIALEVGLDRRKEALETVRRGMKELPDNDDLRHGLADLLVQNGELKEAEEVIAQLREKKYAPPLLDYLEARIHARKGEWAAAEKLLVAVLPVLTRLPGLETQGQLLLGQCHERLGNPDKALLAYQTARKLDPLSTAAHYRIGAILMSLNRSDAAMSEFRSILASPKVPAGMHAIMARALLVRNLRLPPKQRDVREIKRELALAAKETPNAPELAVLQAQTMLLDDPKQVQAVRQALEKARDAHPDAAELWIALAQMAARDGKPQEALRVLEKARSRLKLVDNVAIQLAQLGYLTVSSPEIRKNPDEMKKAAEKARAALAEMEKDVRKLPELDRPSLLSGLADAHLRLGNKAEAERLWKQVAEEQPNNLNLRLVLFDMALLAGSTDETARLVEEIRRVEGEDGAYWRYAEAAIRIQKATPKEQAELSESGRRLLREARQYLVESGRRRPSWPRVPALEAEIDELEGQASAAIEKYQQALSLGERRPTIVRKTVKLLFDERRFAEANQVVHQLLDQENVLISAGLGKLVVESLLSNRDPAERNTEHALELAVKSVAPDSKAYQDHLWLGRIQWVSGKTQEAEKSLRRACDLGEKEPEPWVTLVGFLAATKQTKSAEQVIEEARKKMPADKAALALAVCYENVGDLKRAEENLLAAQKAKPDEVPMLRNVAGYYLRHEELKKAEPSLRAILAPERKAPLADVAWARRGLALVLSSESNRRRFEEALTLIDRNLADTKNALPDQHARALVLATRISRRKEAIRLFEDLARRGPLVARERFILVGLYAAEDNWPQMQLHMVTLLASEGGDLPRYRGFFARHLLQHGDIAGAEKQLAKLEKEPDAPLTREIKARILKAKGKDAEAVAVIRAYAATKDGDPSRAGLLLETLGKDGDAMGLYRREAEQMYRKYVATSDKPDRFLTLATFQSRQHAVADALASCEEARKHKAAPERIALVVTAVLRDPRATKEDRRRGEKGIKDALAQTPDSVPLLICLADLCDGEERFAEAEDIYRRALRKDENNVAILNNLAWLLAFKPSSAASGEALRTIDRAIDLVGASPELLDTRAVVYLSMGQGKSALEDMQKAIGESPSANRYFHLARAVAMAKKSAEGRSEARQAFDEATRRGFEVKSLHPLEKSAGQQFIASLVKR